MSEENYSAPPIYIVKYLSSFQNKLPPNSRASYAAFTELSLSDQATLDGYVNALIPAAGGVMGAYELLTQLGIWLAKQPEAK